MPRKKTEPKPMGRTPKPFNLDMFEELCKIQCTEKEICAALNMCEDTLNQKCKDNYEGHTFSEVFAQKREGGKASLRRAQWSTALETKNPVMQIFLGKNMLGQADKQEIDSNISGNIEVTFSDPQLDEWAK